MALATPVVEWRANVSPFSTLSSLTFTGTGAGGAIPLGTTSNVQTVRIYNNFAAAASIADALNVFVSSYDDELHQGLATTIPVTQTYMQIQVADYNGVTTNADVSFLSIGGQTRHPVPTNGGTISGTGANYITLNLQVNIPANAATGVITQGVWIEFSSTA